MPPINNPEDGRCGYVAFFNRNKIELYAHTWWEAKKLAVAHFKATKKQESAVVVVLAEISGEQVSTFLDS